MEIVFDWIARYGYFGLFSLLVLGIVGLPVPDETLLTFTGYLIYRGQFRPLPALAAAFLGSVCGITLSYTLGRVAGYFLIEKYGARLHIKIERVHWVHDWFRRRGRFTLTFGYFVPGVRHLTAYVAGASELELPVFALFAYSGGLIWCTGFISLGYFLGERWDRASAAVQHWLLAGGVAMAVLAGIAYLLWRRRRPRI